MMAVLPAYNHKILRALAQNVLWPALSVSLSISSTARAVAPNCIAAFGSKLSTELSKTERKGSSKSFIFGRVTVEVVDRYELASFSGFTADDMQIAAESVAVTWSAYNTKPKKFRLILVNELNSANGGSYSGLYRNGEIYLSLSDFKKSQLPRFFFVIMTVANETTHAVQQTKGAVLPDSETDSRYPHIPVEFEANQAAVDVLKAFSPGSEGSISIEGRDYTLPKKSKYRRLSVF